MENPLPQLRTGEKDYPELFCGQVVVPLIATRRQGVIVVDGCGTT